MLEERDASGDLAARYVHGERIDEILRREGPEGTFFYHHDALGSTISLTDSSGALVEQYRYDVFGQPSVFDATGQPLAASTAGNRFLFTGREWLPELGLYDFRNRVYSPLLGRWLQPDPIGLAAGDVNLYRYCAGLCDDQIDPFGLMVKHPFSARVAGLSPEMRAEYEALARDLEREWNKSFLAGNNSQRLLRIADALEKSPDVMVEIIAAPGGHAGEAPPPKDPKGPYRAEIRSTPGTSETLVHELLHILLQIRERNPNADVMRNDAVRQVLRVIDASPTGPNIDAITPDGVSYSDAIIKALLYPGH